MIIMVKQSEKKCGKTECGQCGLPNPMDTDTEKQTRFGMAILQSGKYQNAMQKVFGNQQSKQKISCEFQRLKHVLKSKYKKDSDMQLQFKI